MKQNQRKSQFVFFGLVLCIVSLASGLPHAQEVASVKKKVTTAKDEIPEMVAVSSTVIPVANLFGNPKPEASGAGEVVPYFPSYLYTRKSRFFEKSSKPDTPVRLITKKIKP